jgi:hypothetical protein
MKLLVMQFSPTSRHLIPLRSKYSSQRLILKHRKYMPKKVRITKIIIENVVIGNITILKTVENVFSVYTFSCYATLFWMIFKNKPGHTCDRYAMEARK